MARPLALLAVLLCLACSAGAHKRKHQAALRLVDDDPAEETECDARKRRKNTLKLIKEAPFTGLFYNLRNQTIFEGSAIANVKGEYFVAFDSSFSIGLLDDNFHFRGAQNKLIGDQFRDKSKEESQFEGIAYVPENDTFLLLQETQDHGDHYHPHILTARLHPDRESYDILADCVYDFELDSENKGFESIAYVRNSKGAYLLGQCEGNHCVGGAQGKDAGNGRIVVAQLHTYDDGTCEWRPEAVIQIPKRARFTDYSSFAFNGQKLAILSQENAAVWVGDFDIETMKFLSRGQVFHFPRDNHCEIVFCNLEGIQWIDDRRVVVVSDKAKRYQPFYCDSKDQMVHIFSLPATYDPYAVVDPYGDEDGQGEGGDDVSEAAMEL